MSWGQIPSQSADDDGDSVVVTGTTTTSNRRHPVPVGTAGNRPVTKAGDRPAAVTTTMGIGRRTTIGRRSSTCMDYGLHG